MTKLINWALMEALQSNLHEAPQPQSARARAAAGGLTGYSVRSFDCRYPGAALCPRIRGRRPIGRRRSARARRLDDCFWGIPCARHLPAWSVVNGVDGVLGNCLESVLSGTRLGASPAPKTPSAQKCYRCARNDPLPMCSERTKQLRWAR